MEKSIIKLNNNDLHLSLGNLCRIIKENSLNKVYAGQTEIFAIIFNIDNISDSTVNNYCVGYRAIGSDYKEIYYNYKEKLKKDPNILVDTVLNIVSIIDGYIYVSNDNNESLKIINNNHNFKKVCTSLFNIAKNDTSVTNDFSKMLSDYIEKNNLYLCFINILFYTILEKKQPLYLDNIVKETITNIFTNTNISINDLEKFLKLQLTDGINYTYSLKKMVNDNNPYACFEMGNMEYNGLITGYPRYNEAYKNFSIAAQYNHPRANWIIAHMILKKEIGTFSKSDLNKAYNHLKIAEKLGSVAALNSLGICYLNGYIPDEEKNTDLAIKYFLKAINYDYVYAYNNLGKIYENKKEYSKAFSYYIKSANLEESWACNKVGEFYRQGLGIDKDMKKAFKYYCIASSAPIKLSNPYAKYNLAKYFYLNGNYEANIEKDEEKAIELLESASFNNVIEASILLVYYYALKYINSFHNNDYDMMLFNIKKVEVHNQYNNDIKKEIEKILKEIKDKKRITIDI